jgi:hypothetical protein
MLQACAQYPEIMYGATTQSDFQEKIREKYPIGSDASLLRKEIERQGSRIFSAPSRSGIEYGAGFQGGGFPCNPFARLLWSEDRAGKITKLDADLRSVCL